LKKLLPGKPSTGVVPSLDLRKSDNDKIVAKKTEEVEVVEAETAIVLTIRDNYRLTFNDDYRRKMLFDSLISAEEKNLVTIMEEILKFEDSPQKDWKAIVPNIAKLLTEPSSLVLLFF